MWKYSETRIRSDHACSRTHSSKGCARAVRSSSTGRQGRKPRWPDPPPPTAWAATTRGRGTRTAPVCESKRVRLTRLHVRKIVAHNYAQHTHVGHAARSVEHGAGDGHPESPQGPHRRPHLDHEPDALVPWGSQAEGDGRGWTRTLHTADSGCSVSPCHNVKGIDPRSPAHHHHPRSPLTPLTREIKVVTAPITRAPAVRTSAMARQSSRWKLMLPRGASALNLWRMIQMAMLRELTRLKHAGPGYVHAHTDVPVYPGIYLCVYARARVCLSMLRVCVPRVAPASICPYFR